MTYTQKITFGEMRTFCVRRVSTAALRSLDGKPAAHARRRQGLRFNGVGNAIGDPGRVVQELHNHLPRIVENQQRFGRIVGQLAYDHYGLEPQGNVFF